MRRIATLLPALAWSMMIELEPHLTAIIEEAEAISEADWHDYERCKRQLSRLVGHGAADERLASCRCYEIAMDRLTEVLGPAENGANMEEA